MRRKKQKKEPKLYEPTELKDLTMLNEIKTFSDDELQRAMAMAADVEGYGIGLTQNYPDDQTLVSIGMTSAWHARIVREVIAIQMFNRSQEAKEGGTDDKKKGGGYL
jgi:hypothetical protein